jgi:hypothetical protein
MDVAYQRDERNVRLMHAWLLQVAVLALHVTDEAITGFLDFYNPLVLAARARIGWFPMPTFTFGTWLTGLAVLIVALGALTPAVRRGLRATRPAAYALSSLMFANGMGHLIGAAYFRTWVPGATSAPLMLFASALLFRRTLMAGATT